jgi:hypothetical protein
MIPAVVVLVEDVRSAGGMEHNLPVRIAVIVRIIVWDRLVASIEVISYLNVRHDALLTHVIVTANDLRDQQRHNICLPCNQGQSSRLSLSAQRHFIQAMQVPSGSWV